MWDYIRGFLSIFEFGQPVFSRNERTDQVLQRYKFCKERTDEEALLSDWEAIGEDWKIIGNDLQNAIDKVKDDYNRDNREI